MAYDKLSKIIHTFLQESDRWSQCRAKFTRIMFWIGNALRLVRREPIRILSVLQRQRFEGCEPIRQKFTLNPTIHFTRTFSLVADECWSCKQVLMETGSPFCPGCNVLQRPPNDLVSFRFLFMTVGNKILLFLPELFRDNGHRPGIRPETNRPDTALPKASDPLASR